MDFPKPHFEGFLLRLPLLLFIVKIEEWSHLVLCVSNALLLSVKFDASVLKFT